MADSWKIIDYPPAICQPSTVGKVYLALAHVLAAPSSY